VIDLHSHILPGVDDGARTIEQSLEIARAAAEDGIEVVAATPHVREDWPTSAEAMERSVAELRRALAAAEIPLELRPGGEIALDWVGVLTVDELRRFGLAGNPNYVLLEFPYHGWPLPLPHQIDQLRAAGITPVLAHPERNGDVARNPGRLRPLVEAGALVQLTAASVDGRLGEGPHSTSRRLLRLGLAHMLASDAHAPAVRSVGLTAAAESVGDRALAEWLTCDCPRAILADEPLPERPHRRWFAA
jgi:protein-tyrosine phosphatase